MNIAIGSKNLVKIHALEEVLKDYPQFADAKIHSFAVPSDVSEQPFSIEEIITGAKNRSQNAFKECHECDYSFGIESGLFQALGTQTGYLEACICCIFDGTNFHTGLSCGFEVPHPMLKLILEKKLDLNQACFQSGFTKNEKLGSAEGMIGILTKGRINRKAYTKQCLITALIQLENSSWYE